MAVTSICCKSLYKDQILVIQSKAADVFRGTIGDKSCRVWCASKSSTNEKQLRSLDSYFVKLRNDTNQPSLNAIKKSKVFLDQTDQLKLKEGLGSLDDYFRKLNKDVEPKNYMVSSFNEDEVTKLMQDIIGRDFEGSEETKAGVFLELKYKDGGTDPKISQISDSYDETSDLQLISILASINIAVFLFEIASPIGNPELELLSLPSMYGAKINNLILVGEWWRLVTPMFLHSGLLHVTLSCWVLLTFGPQVCRGYGSFTFFLIYVLGGISGNLTSFYHTPEPTIGGTGPVFAIIGAWLVYQIQNKGVLAKEVYENMFRKAIIATALSFVLSSFGPIDDWTHFGAAVTGIVYGYFTCPVLQVDDATSKSGQEEGITLVRRYADPCKSLLIFSIFLFVLSSSIFFIDPPLNSLLPSGTL